MKLPWKPIVYNLMLLSVITDSPKKSFIEWIICILLDFSSITMKRMRSVMDWSHCFYWLDKRSWKVVSTSVIQTALVSGVVSSDSPISSDVTKVRPCRGRLFGVGEAQAACTIVAPSLGG